MTAHAEHRRQAVARAVTAMREAVQRGQQPTVADLARVARYSECHFPRLFRAVTGRSPMEYLTGLRFAEARRLLATTDLPVADVCHRVGYRSWGTFSARFSRQFGVPPLRYRQLQRNGGGS